MGNIIQINNAVVSSEDRKYLALTDDVIASDSFVDSFLKDHPKCKLRGYPTGMRDEGNQLKSSLKVPRKVSRLVQLFSSRPLHHNSSPEHYQVSDANVIAILMFSDHNSRFNLYPNTEFTESHCMLGGF